MNLPQGVKQHPVFNNYGVTKDGRVWSGKSKKFLKPNKATKYGHLKVSLYKNNEEFVNLIHRLVLETYVGLCPEEMECRHLNGNPENNELNNLKWGTRSENTKDAVKHGTHAHAQKGEKHHNSKLEEKDVRMIVYMWRTGKFTQREIAKIYKVCFVTIHDIVNKRRWKHIWRK